jgi:hypothetical protein
MGKWACRHFQGEPSDSGRYGRDREKLVPISRAINGSMHKKQRCGLHTYSYVVYMHRINYRAHFYRINAVFHSHMFLLYLPLI